jgi:hypothetical protein
MRFRPGDLPQGDPSDTDTPVEWEDNWLSNTMAYVSHKLLPGWCQTEDHWTSATTRFLFTDCPCCLLFRGLSLGFLAGLIIGIMMTTITMVLIFSGGAG